MTVFRMQGEKILLCVSTIEIWTDHIQDNIAEHLRVASNKAAVWQGGKRTLIII